MSTSSTSSGDHEHGPLLGSAGSEDAVSGKSFKDPMPLDGKKRHEVQVCCFPAPCLEKVPVVRTIFKKNEEKVL